MKKIAYNLVMVVCIMVCIYSGYKAYTGYQDYKTGDEFYEQTKEQYIITGSPQEDTEDKTVSVEEGKSLPEWAKEITVDLQSLMDVNPDIVAWIYFENEEISYPVLYSGDNDYYLHRDYLDQKLTAGSIFVDGNNKQNFTDYHTLIYGHNMKNKSMFGKLKYYKQDNYYEDHQYFQIITPHSKMRYRIFAYHDVDEDDQIYQVYFENEEEFETFVEQEIVKDSYIESKTPGKHSKIITLSTCSGSNDRFVVSAVLVDQVLEK